VDEGAEKDHQEETVKDHEKDMNDVSARDKGRRIERGKSTDTEIKVETVVTEVGKGIEAGNAIEVGTGTITVLRATHAASDLLL
jgi:hypothetical protein